MFLISRFVPSSIIEEMGITHYNKYYQKIKQLRGVQGFHYTINLSLTYSYDCRGPIFANVQFTLFRPKFSFMRVDMTFLQAKM